MLTKATCGKSRKHFAADILINGTSLYRVNRPNAEKAKRVQIPGEIEITMCCNYHHMSVEEFYSRPGTDLWVSDVWPVVSQAELLAKYRVIRDYEAIVDGA